MKTAGSSANIKDEQASESMKRPNDATLDTETKRMKVTPQLTSATIQVDGTSAGSFAVGSSDSNFMV